MKSYLNLSYIKRKDTNMPIMKGLLKHGYNNFSLIIIEYNNNHDLESRETYWINYLKPYYNVLEQAYSSSGFTHTQKTKELMRIRAKERKHTEYTKNLISESLKGFRNPFFNSKHSRLSKELISSKKSKGLIYIYDNMLKFLVVFTSLTDFKKTIKANMPILKRCLDSNRLFRGGWYIRSSLLNEYDKPMIYDKTTKDYINLINNIQSNARIKQAIYVFDSKTKKFLSQFNGIIEAEKVLVIRHEKIKNSIINNKSVEGYLFSYHRLLNLPF
jgi:group I intron endonuclease